MDDSEFLISQYADDSTLILEDDTQSLNHTLEVVELFSTCSGLRASYDKTQAVWIGALKISWIKRVLDPDNYAPWKVLLTDDLEDLG